MIFARLPLEKLPPQTASSAGTGFLLGTGVIVTNVHVVATCTKETLDSISTANKHVKFSRIIADGNRDLALLVPVDNLTNGLELAAKDRPEPGTEVTTWGYPFLYNGASPLFSLGYVAGYRNEIKNNQTVKHIVVNGAFNHGNSGGPLLVARSNEVIGIVVLTYNFYPPEIQNIIDDLQTHIAGFRYSVTRPDGSKQSLSDGQLAAIVLNEFYQKTQVMIGEAIAGSELRAMIKEHASELPATSALTKK